MFRRGLFCQRPALPEHVLEAHGTTLKTSRRVLKRRPTPANTDRSFLKAQGRELRLSLSVAPRLK
eukprot:15447940-Alexandrium_andersonii.AAC.1